MFDIDSFVADCRAALAERSSEAVRDVVRRAIAEPDAILKVLGEPSGASAGVVFQAADLTILNVVWGARQWTLPHNHNHRAIIGMYGGGEDNIFWRRLPEDAKGGASGGGRRPVAPARGCRGARARHNSLGHQPARQAVDGSACL